MSKRSKFVFLTWVGSNVSVMKKAKMSTDKLLMKEIIQVRVPVTPHIMYLSLALISSQFSSNILSSIPIFVLNFVLSFSFLSLLHAFQISLFM